MTGVQTCALPISFHLKHFLSNPTNTPSSPTIPPLIVPINAILSCSSPSLRPYKLPPPSQLSLSSSLQALSSPSTSPLFIPTNTSLPRNENFLSPQQALSSPNNNSIVHNTFSPHSYDIPLPTLSPTKHPLFSSHKLSPSPTIIPPSSPTNFLLTTISTFFIPTKRSPLPERAFFHTTKKGVLSDSFLIPFL